MNDGYLSYLLMLISAILLVSGWKNILAREVKAQELIIFFTAWIIGLTFVIPITASGMLQGVYVALMLLLMRTLCRTSRGEGSYLAAAGVLIGMVGYFVHVLYESDPVLILYDPTIDIALVCGVLAWTVTRDVSLQASVITISLLILDIAAAWQTGSTMTTFRLGDLAFQDSWWGAVCTSKLLTITGELLIRISSYGGKRLMLWMRSLRR
jgi:hypothetical protein